jgi:paired amphipathic helix protein Sin3a
MRELRVEDALLYLDQVKVEFGDRPHIYNEFLDIMKTFKTQQIDTPGVIRRVSNLFQGNRRLVLGFNTFLPEGYKIELPADGNGPPVAVFRAPGSNVAHVLSGPMAGMPNIPMAQQRAEAAAAAAEAPVPGKFFPRPANPPAAARNPLPLANRRPGGGPLIPGAPHPPHQGPYDDAEGEGMVPQQQPVPPVPRPPVAARSPVPPMRPSPPSAKGGPPPPPMDHPPLAPQPPVAAAANGVGAPLEFDHAINYVTTIKRRFAAEPETYKKFLEILHTYQKEQRGIKEVLDEVSVLFADHPDLLKEFTYFLPDAVQAQAKAQLDLAAKASEARKRNQAKLAIMSQAQSMQAPPKSSARGDNDRLSIPFGATLPRSVEQEREIMASAEHGIVTFEPARPPRRNEPTIAQAAARLGRPQTIPRKPVVMRTPEAIFFERAKAHLNRKELVWERPSGTKRHTPHTEFIKCLHLYGTGVLDKDELFLLMRNLFTQGHAPKGAAGNNPIIAQDAANLLRDFEEILYSRGAYAEQRLMEIYRTKFGTMRTRDFDFTDCETPTPSYRAYPGSFPKERFWVHPEQSPEEAEILNRDFACVGDMERMTDSKDFFDGVRSRHNVYEEALCRVEDERYEVDMAIQRNAQAIKDIEPLAEECLRLGKREEDDGQPIGRLRYKLKPDSLHSIAIGAIGRAYGDRGDEVLQHLVQNPVIVLPIVYRRLKIKDAEWRKVKDDLTGRWDAATAANYEGSRDVRSYFDRKELERLFDASYLIDQCKKAKNFVKDPPKEMNPIADTVRPNFSIGIEDPGAIFYEATVSMPCKVDSLHRDAIQLVSRKLQAMPSLSALDRERIGRIIAEVVVPWFGYPAHWVMEEVRESFAGSAAPAVVKCKF